MQVKEVPPSALKVPVPGPSAEVSERETGGELPIFPVQAGGKSRYLETEFNSDDHSVLYSLCNLRHTAQMSLGKGGPSTETSVGCLASGC